MGKRVLFVSHTAKVDDHYDDPSTRYRCHTQASSLRNRGHITTVISQKKFEIDNTIEEYFDYFVCHRPYMTEHFVDFLVRHKGSQRIIADFDDLIFDVSNSELMPSHRFRGQPLHLASAYLGANAAACRHFANFSVSTRPLAEKVRSLFGEHNTHVIPNSLEPGYIARAEEIRTLTSLNRPYKLGYFSGTATHDADLASVSSSIQKMFENYPSAMMLILGPADIPKQLLPFRERIHHHKELVHFSKLPYVMAQVETVIAPLEWNEFTVCKSGLKFFEAALVGCSVVATPIPDIDRFNSKMLRKCSSVEDWDRALTEPFNLSPQDIETEVERILPSVNAETIIADFEGAFLK